MKFLPKAVSILTVLNMTAISLTARADASKNARQCLADICGGEANYLGTSARGSFGDLTPQNVTDYETKYIVPRLNQIVKRQAALQQSQLDASTGWISKASVDPLTPTQLAYVALSSFPYLNGSQFNAAIVRGKDEDDFTVDAAILKSKVPQLDPVKIDKFVAVENTFLQSKSFRTSLKLDNIAPYVLRYSATKEASTESAKQALWNQAIDEEISDLKQNELEIHDLLYSKNDLKLLAKARDVSTLNSFEQGQLTILIAKIERHTAVRSSQVVAAMVTSGLTLADILELTNWSKRSIAIRAVVSSAEMISKSQIAAQNNCLPTVTRAFASTPSQFRIDKMTELLAKVKTAAKSAGARLLHWRIARRCD